MFRAFLTGLAALVFSCCASLDTASSSPTDGPVYLVQVTNMDWDTKEVRLHCDGRYRDVIRLSTGQTVDSRLRGSECRMLRFYTVDLGGEIIFSSPPISMSSGSIEIRLTESPNHTHWRTGLLTRKSGR